MALSKSEFNQLDGALVDLTGLHNALKLVDEVSSAKAVANCTVAALHRAISRQVDDIRALVDAFRE